MSDRGEMLAGDSQYVPTLAEKVVSSKLAKTLLCLRTSLG